MAHGECAGAHPTTDPRRNAGDAARVTASNNSSSK
jgi:hypothetical protein